VGGLAGPPTSPSGADGTNAGAVDPLGLSAERFRELAHRLVDRVADHWAELDQLPVIQEADRDSLAALSGPIPVEPSDIDELIETLAEHALANMQNSAHPRFFARVPSPASLTGILGEWLGVGYNGIASSWGGGSGTSQVELVVVEWLRELMGFPPGTEGVLVSGGSIGNMTALAAARAAGYDGTVFLSDQTHSSIGRALALLGLADEQIRVVPARDRYRWAFDDVRAALLADRGDGDSRGIVIATAGTTNTGACDPLDALADVCTEQDLWLHVDGAYGAPAAMTEAGRAVLSGLERADSLTLDPHKWLFQPFDVGAVLVRQAGVLEACFTMNPEYLRDVLSQAEGEVDMRNRGPELSRRARATKVWLTLKAHGTRAVADAIDRSIALAEEVQALLENDPRWEVVTPAQLGVITFAQGGLSGPEHVERARQLTASGFAALTCTELAHRTVYRLCLINPLTTVADVEQTLERLIARDR
jgi:aromatic-L-amino-acid decarboxylase